MPNNKHKRNAWLEEAKRVAATGACVAIVRGKLHVDLLAACAPFAFCEPHFTAAACFCALLLKFLLWYPCHRSRVNQRRRAHEVVRAFQDHNYRNAKECQRTLAGAPTVASLPKASLKKAVTTAQDDGEAHEIEAELVELKRYVATEYLEERRAIKAKWVPARKRREAQICKERAKRDAEALKDAMEETAAEAEDRKASEKLVQEISADIKDAESAVKGAAATAALKLAEDALRKILDAHGRVDRGTQLLPTELKTLYSDASTWARRNCRATPDPSVLEELEEAMQAYTNVELKVEELERDIGEFDRTCAGIASALENLRSDAALIATKAALAEAEAKHHEAEAAHKSELAKLHSLENEYSAVRWVVSALSSVAKTPEVVEQEKVLVEATRAASTARTACDELESKLAVRVAELKINERLAAQAKATERREFAQDQLKAPLEERQAAIDRCKWRVAKLRKWASKEAGSTARQLQVLRDELAQAQAEGSRGERERALRKTKLLRAFQSSSPQDQEEAVGGAANDEESKEGSAAKSPPVALLRRQQTVQRREVYDEAARAKDDADELAELADHSSVVVGRARKLIWRAQALKDAALKQRADADKDVVEVQARSRRVRDMLQRLESCRGDCTTAVAAIDKRAEAKEYHSACSVLASRDLALRLVEGSCNAVLWLGACVAVPLMVPAPGHPMAALSPALYVSTRLVSAAAAAAQDQHEYLRPRTLLRAPPMRKKGEAVPPAEALLQIAVREEKARARQKELGRLLGRARETVKATRAADAEADALIKELEVEVARLKELHPSIAADKELFEKAREALEDAEARYLERFAQKPWYEGSSNDRGWEPRCAMFTVSCCTVHDEEIWYHSLSEDFLVRILEDRQNGTFLVTDRPFTDEVERKRLKEKLEIIEADVKENDTRIGQAQAANKSKKEKSERAKRQNNLKNLEKIKAKIAASIAASKESKWLVHHSELETADETTDRLERERLEREEREKKERLRRQRSYGNDYGGSSCGSSRSRTRKDSYDDLEGGKYEYYDKQDDRCGYGKRLRKRSPSPRYQSSGNWKHDVGNVLTQAAVNWLKG